MALCVGAGVLYARPRLKHEVPFQSCIQASAIHIIVVINLIPPSLVISRLLHEEEEALCFGCGF